MPLTDVYLGLGSNIDRERNLLAALDALAALFGPIDCSPVFESEPVGIRSGCFFNMVVRIRTAMPPAGLASRLKVIEAQQGRLTAGPRQLPLDIDVLLYGELNGDCDGLILPRPRMLESAHVLWPLALLAPGLRHPGATASYADLWRASRPQHALWPVALNWRGQPLTPDRMLAQPLGKGRPIAVLRPDAGLTAAAATAVLAVPS